MGQREALEGVDCVLLDGRGYDGELERRIALAREVLEGRGALVVVVVNSTVSPGPRRRLAALGAVLVEEGDRLMPALLQLWHGLLGPALELAGGQR